MKIRSTAALRLLNSCFPRSAAPSLGRRKDQAAYAQWEFDTAGGSLEPFGPHRGIEGKRLLDVGCGLGGKSAWYALNGAEAVIAVDLDPERVHHAQQFAESRQIRNISFRRGNAGHLPELEGARFQVVLFNDAFEHLDSPAEALAECWRLLESGGKVLIAFPPYGSPWGAHLFAQIKIPWAQHLFTERVLLEVWKNGFRAAADADTGVITRMKLAEVEAARTVADLRQLNRMTIERFRELVAGSPFMPVLIREETPRWAIPRPNRSLRLRELLVTRVVAVLEKRG